MKILTLSALLLLTLPAFAQDFSAPLPSRWHVQVDAGANFIEDTTVKQFLGIPSPNTRMTFDPGVRLGLGAGYHFNDIVAAEIESGFSYNTAKDLTVGGVSVGQFGSADVWGVPVIVGALVSPLPDTLLKPYIGAGIGAHAVFGSLSIPTAGFSDSGYSLVFAWQVKAGFTYEVCPNVELLFAYRLLGVGDHKLKLTAFEDTLIHTLSLGALLRF